MPSSRIDRRIGAVLAERLAESPVVALQGARSVGKSTVLRDLASRHRVSVVDLDTPGVRQQVANDPSSFVNTASPVCIDEYQRVPIVLDAIKAELNKDAESGRFVITGSSRFDALPIVAQSLTGRLQMLEIMPFSQGELDGVHEDFLEVALTEPERHRSGEPSTTSREEYVERICRGGFPMAVQRSDGGRRRWYEGYATSSLERDVRDLARIRQAAVLPRLLEVIAGQTAQLLNVTRAATAAHIEPRTADNYVRLLEALFLIRRLPAWGRTLRAKAGAVPKVHLVDSGLAAYLMQLNPAKLARRDPAALAEFGHLLETFVVGELLKQASWSEQVVNRGHWRTRDGSEVDLVIERYDGAVVGFEVKSSRQVNPSDTTGLVALRDLLGDQFLAGYVLNTGEYSSRLGDRIYTCPIDRLWQPTPNPTQNRRRDHTPPTRPS